jgi:isochorismate hydrolase
MRPHVSGTIKATGERRKDVNFMNKALLIIDVQRALCSGEEEAFDSRRLIERINKRSSPARERRDPRCRHSARGRKRPFGIRFGRVEARSPARSEADDIHVRKTAPDSFHHTELQDILAARSIDELVICGLQSECCVDATTRRALALGYPVTLVSDGHSTMDTAALKAPQSPRKSTKRCRRADFGSRIRLIPAADVRIEA